MNITSVDVDSVPLISLGLNTASKVVMTQVNYTQGVLTDFLRLDTADSLSLNNVKLNSLNGSVAGASLDTTKSALLTLSNVKNVTLDSIQVSSSTLLVSPVLMIDTCSMVTLKNSLFQSVKIQSNDMIVVKKP